MKVRHTLLGSAVAACLGLCTATAHAEGSLSIYHWFESVSYTHLTLPTIYSV